ncbi:P-loop containing nucleoside triphosphate hydrolase protein [Mycena leptocephala]|nr:P-loop containing nucleoside triphosphate hydrolase protein [Mycena leptocephala]
MGPLLVKALINFAKARAAAKAAGMEPANIRHGVGMAFGLLIVIVLASICQHQLGPSALAGFALFLPIIPLQKRIMAHQFSLRQASMKWMDERAGRVLEVVASMRVVKYFCYEGSFLARRFRIRTQELRRIRKIQHSQSANVGERSLLSLARALVKDSRVVILDKATASVDLETDNKIQRMIQTQFKDRTLICIAHRLRTIISYDRILVVDAGKIAEFDTPLNLFNRNESLFRSLCDKSNITSEDIDKAIISDDVE